MKNTKRKALDHSSPTFLTFNISGQHYGISIDNVIEILQLPPATELPELPAFYRGIINLRGRVIPLMDVNMRFGRPEKEYCGRTCVIIVDIDGVHTGLIVDNVEEVLEISHKLTFDPPSFSEDYLSSYITSIATVDKNTVLLLNVRRLIPVTGIADIDNSLKLSQLVNTAV